MFLMVAKDGVLKPKCMRNLMQRIKINATNRSIDFVSRMDRQIVCCHMGGDEQYFSKDVRT